MPSLCRMFMRYLIVFFLLTSCRAVAQFEGIVESRNVTIDQTGSRLEYVTSIWVKNGMARIVNSASESVPAVIMIYRSDLKLVWMINDDDKTYVEISHADQPRKSGAQKGKGTVKKSGQGTTVLGYPCDHYVLKSGEATTEVWGTKRLAGLAATLAAILGIGEEDEESPQVDELTALGVFPLRTVTKIGGNVIDSQDVTRIEKKSLADDIFSLPSGYTRQSAGGMLK